MAKTKRQRQKEGRQARLQAARTAQRRQRARQRVITVVALLLLFVMVAVLFAAFLGDDGEDVTAGEASTTTVTPTDLGEVVQPTAPPPGQTITGPTSCPAADGSAPRTTTFEQPPPLCIDPARTYTAEVATSMGSFTIALDPAAAPQTVNNFVVLSRYHYYDGVPFHRIIPTFVVQGGDAVGEPIGSGGPGYTIPDELPADLAAYTRGSLAMANSGPDTGGSQFFVYLGPDPLPGPDFSRFGQVTAGLDVVEQIADAGTASGGITDEVIIDSVTITEA